MCQAGVWPSRVVIHFGRTFKVNSVLCSHYIRNTFSVQWKLLSAPQCCERIVSAEPLRFARLETLFLLSESLSDDFWAALFEGNDQVNDLVEIVGGLPLDVSLRPLRLQDSKHAQPLSDIRVLHVCNTPPFHGSGFHKQTSIVWDDCRRVH